jgi:hypothetical protein
MTGKEKRRREFLAKASDADHQATKTTDTVGRACWLKIADGYRELARQMGGPDSLQD